MSAPVVHFDICGPDTEALQRFYGDLLGWPIQSRGPGYALITTPEGGPDGAIAEEDTPRVGISVAVADLNAATATSQRLGGRVVMPPTDNGWVVKAQIEDPAGNLLTLIQAAPPA